jgi:hypothetical protein
VLRGELAVVALVIAGTGPAGLMVRVKVTLAPGPLPLLALRLIV